MNKSLTTLIVSGVIAAALALGVAVQSAVAAAAPRECGVDQLSAKLVNDPDADGAGQVYGTLTLTNKSASTCKTGGWVGLGLENGNGTPVHTDAVRIDGSAQKVIDLKPGQRVTSQLHWSDVEGTGDRAGGPCFRAPSKILVTPPNSYESLKLPWAGGVACENGSISITPLV